LGQGGVSLSSHHIWTFFTSKRYHPPPTRRKIKKLFSVKVIEGLYPGSFVIDGVKDIAFFTRLTFNLHIPANAPVARYNLAVTSWVNEDGRYVEKSRWPKDIYKIVILFNSWCPNDQVFLAIIQKLTIGTRNLG
jgi:hypothetical protein